MVSRILKLLAPSWFQGVGKKKNRVEAQGVGCQRDNQQIASPGQCLQIFLGGPRLSVENDMFYVLGKPDGLFFVHNLERKTAALAPCSCAAVGVAVHK